MNTRAALLLRPLLLPSLRATLTRNQVQAYTFSLQINKMSSTAEPAQAETSPWWAAFPEPKANCHSLEASDVKNLLESHSTAGTETSRGFLLVDVRRTDWEGGTIATSINLPAHTLYQTRPVIYQLCKQAGVKTIIFYCGSSNGRGPRSARWMQDYLNEVGEASMSAAILKGGIKGWQRAYGGELMDWYDEKFWAEQNA